MGLSLLLAACGASPALQLTGGTDYHSFVTDRDGGRAGTDPATLRFRPSLCEASEQKPEYKTLGENDLIEFLARQHIDARIERPRADLTYAILTGAGTRKPVWLRVAILKDASEAGRELHEALLQHGEGSWGVHRSNLAVLGPIASPDDAIAFAATTKLACWGVFTVAGLDDTFVVPGAYTEL